MQLFELRDALIKMCEQGDPRKAELQVVFGGEFANPLKDDLAIEYVVSDMPSGVVRFYTK